MRFFYSLFILFYGLGICIASLFNEKAKKWCNGRKSLFKNLQLQCAGFQNIFWFHCASLGEFEQGKPLMQKIKQNIPGSTILVTFFSPSGFEIKKNEDTADVVSYLPADLPFYAAKFIKTVNPEAAIFVKYEYWFNFMNTLTLNHIPFYYVSAIFRPSQYFFKKYGNWFAKQLKKASFFFVQNQESESLLNSIGIANVEITGDTRFDRVHAIASENYEMEFVSSFKTGKKLIVAGSTWSPDESLLNELFNSFSASYKLIIAPHLVDEAHIEQIKKSFSGFKCICYSGIENTDLSEFQVLLIDKIGLLSKIYKYADIVYIGGAFETGLHNILEAAVFGIPLFFGPRYTKFNEAAELVRMKGAFSIRNAEEMSFLLKQLDEDNEFYKITCDICKKFVHQNLGASDKIFNKLISIQYV